MTLHQRPPGETLPDTSPTLPARRQWSWLAVARTAWIVLALVLLVYFVAAISVSYQTLQTACARPNSAQCLTLLSPGTVQALAQLHLSVAAYLNIVVAIDLMLSSLFWVVGVLIFWRTSREWRGLFFSFVLVLFGAGGIIADGIVGIPVTVQTPLLLQLLVYVSRVIANVQWPALLAFILAFPTGRFTPRWSWLLFVLLVVDDVVPVSSNSGVNTVVSVAGFLIFVSTVGVQVYRYMRVYDLVQRQQTKWFVFTIGIAVFYNVAYSVLGALVPGLGALAWFQLLNGLNTLLILVAFPLGVGIAILRYRLWDIDRLINRTLVYGSLTVLLVALYVGLILALQALVRAVTGGLSQQPLVIVASTLVIAALFQLLRRGLQALIDRRFYRSKYDAAKITAAFSATLRNEVELDQLREQLIAVVQETMQPSQFSLWVPLARRDGSFLTPHRQAPPKRSRST